MDKNKTLFILDDCVPSIQESNKTKFFTQGRHMQMSLIKPTFQDLSCITCGKSLDIRFNMYDLCTRCHLDTLCKRYENDSWFRYECAQRQKECKVQLPVFQVSNLCQTMFHYPTEELPTHSAQTTNSLSTPSQLGVVKDMKEDVVEKQV